MIASAADSSPIEETVLVLTRLAPDAEAICQTLDQLGIPCLLCAEIEQFCELLPQCLTAVLTIEAITLEDLERIREAFSRQPPWSDVPLILLTGRTLPDSLQEELPETGNVTVVERPMRQSSLLSIIRSVERARRKQFEVRALLRNNETLNEQLRRAMTETHHRVKNNLQLISALIDLSTLDEREHVSRSELIRLGTHINMLAAIHDILTFDARRDGDGSTLSVRAVLEKLIPLMQQTVPGRQLQYHIDDVRLPARWCTSLAMITNELVANALKYTMRDVRIQFQVAGKQARLSVEDDGAGFPIGFDPITAANTGLDLVLNLSSHDLSGNVVFENTEQGGGCVVLTFRIP